MKEKKERKVSLYKVIMLMLLTIFLTLLIKSFILLSIIITLQFIKIYVFVIIIWILFIKCEQNKDF